MKKYNFYIPYLISAAVVAAFARVAITAPDAPGVLRLEAPKLLFIGYSVYVWLVALVPILINVCFNLAFFDKIKLENIKDRVLYCLLPFLAMAIAVAVASIINLLETPLVSSVVMCITVALTNIVSVVFRGGKKNVTV